MAFKLTVEVPLFLAFFGFLLTDSLNTNLMIYRTCYVTLGLDKHNCSLLGKVNNATTQALEKLVQPKADIITMTKTSIESIFSALICLSIGSWSDRFGRKPIIVSNLIGYTLMMWVMSVFAAIEEASPWYMLTCSIPVVLSGGGASFLTVLLAYLTDITSNENRGLRMGIFEATMAVAVLLGNITSSYLLNATNYVVVYLVATLSIFFGLLYSILFLPESLEEPESGNKIRALFDTQNISGMFQTIVKPRPFKRRPIIILLVISLAIYFVTIAGDGSVFFLFMREKFQWTFRIYTLYNSVTNILWISGSVILVYVIHHKLKVHELLLIVAGFFGMTVGPLIQGLANVDWLIYVAALVKFPSACLTPMTRSLISKLVEENEAAKIFAVFNIISSLLGLVGAPVYTILYNATMTKSPGIFNFVTAGSEAFNTICILLVLFLRPSGRYAPLDEVDTDEN